MRLLTTSIVGLFATLVLSTANAANITVVGPAGPVAAGSSVSVDVILNSEGVVIDTFAFSLTSNGVAVSGSNVMVFELPILAPVPDGSDIAPFGQAKFPQPGFPVNAIVATATFTAGTSGTLDIDAFFSTPDGVVRNGTFLPTTFNGYSVGIAPTVPALSLWPRAVLAACLVATFATLAQRRPSRI
jgi:hypothetical protein